MSSRDLAYLVDTDIKGAAIDLSRPAAKSCDYGVFENLKNGFLMTGKYKGRMLNFPPLKVIIFSNTYPDRDMLSQDRWQVMTVNAPELSDMRKVAVVAPHIEYPFQEPPELPNLEEDFNLRDIILITVCALRRATTILNQMPWQLQSLNTSLLNRDHAMHRRPAASRCHMKALMFSSHHQEFLSVPFILIKVNFNS